MAEGTHVDATRAGGAAYPQQKSTTSVESKHDGMSRVQREGFLVGVGDDVNVKPDQRCSEQPPRWICHWHVRGSINMISRWIRAENGAEEAVQFPRT